PADGEYTWQVRLVPRVSAEVKQKLAEAREAGDDAAAARIQAEAHLNQEIVQSGGFSIMNGAFAAGGSEETTPAVQGQSAGRKVTTNALNPKAMDVVTADDAIIQGSA